MKALALLMLITLAIRAYGQECRSDEFSSFKNVKGAVSSWMVAPKGMVVLDSIREKSVERSGDSAAVAIAKVVSDDDLNSPIAMTRVLFILRMAFSAPQIIEFCSDRQPRVTMMLLEHLRHFQQGRFDTEIEKAKSLILARDTQIPSTPVPQ